MNIRMLDINDTQLFPEIRKLLIQLTGDHTRVRNFSKSDLHRVFTDESVAGFGLFKEEVLIGFGLIAFHETFLKTVAAFEELVVDVRYRGIGYGEMLLKYLIEYARRHKATSVEFTSSPKREAANALYQKIGFERIDTNVYRLKL